MFCSYIMTLFLQCVGCEECTNFPKSRYHFSILGARMVDTKQVPS